MSTHLPLPSLPRLAFAVGVWLALALLACADTAEDNPYDPESDRTVAGRVPIALVLPHIEDGDELSAPGQLEEALSDIALVVRPVDTEDVAAPLRPLEAPGDVRLDRLGDGRRALVRTVVAPYGDYDVEVSHRRGLFEPVTRRITTELAARGGWIEVPLRRARLGVAADFAFGGRLPPDGAWFELRGLQADPGPPDSAAAVAACVDRGRSIRRFEIGGVSALREVAGEEPPVLHPLTPFICGVVGGPGFQSQIRLFERPIHPAGPGTGPTLDAVDFTEPFTPAAARASLDVVGRPGAAAIDAADDPRAGVPLRSARGDTRVGGRLVLLSIRLAGALNFGGGAPENRVRRIAVLDGRTAAGSTERGRFAALDALPVADGLPYLGALDPAECGAIDPPSAPLAQLLRERQALRGQILDPRVGGESRAGTERLLPYCLAGGGPVRLLLEVASGAVHAFEVQVEIDRAPVERVDVEIVEDRPGLDEAPAESGRLSPMWRGRHPVHAASRVYARLRVIDSSVEPGSPWRVTADVVHGELRDAGWMLPPCRPGFEVLVGEVRPTDGRMGETLDLPITDALARPAEGAGPLRLQRDRLCLYVEDGVGNLRVKAVDVDVVDGRLVAELKPGATPDEGEASGWQRAQCLWPESSGCFGASSVLAVSDRIVFQTVVDEASVHDSITRLADRGDFGLRAMVVQVGRTAGVPMPFVQSRYLSHAFDADGTHLLKVYGVDLLGREVPFAYAGSSTVEFLRDSRPPRTRERAFMTCGGCPADVDICFRDGARVDPCLLCIGDDFVLPDRSLLAPTASPEIPIRFDFDFAPADEPLLCALTREVGPDRPPAAPSAEPVCGQAVELTLPAGRLDDPPESGEVVQLATDVVDRACNGDAARQSLVVRFDGAAPRLGTADDEEPGGGDRATEVRCRHLAEICLAAGEPSCWRSLIGSGECARGGRRLLEDVDFTLLDAASIDLPIDSIRYRLVLAAEAPPRPGSVCGEPGWRVVVGGERRTAGCPERQQCACLRDAERMDLYPRDRVPVAWYDGASLHPVELAAHDEIDATPEGLQPRFKVLDGVRPYLYVEDAVGNVAVRALVDRDCADGAECIERTYRVLIRDQGDGGPGVAPDWLTLHGCVADAETGVVRPTGAAQRPDDPDELFCERR